MGSEHYCLRWNNHQSNLLGVFSQLLQDESLVDVTLACSEGASIRAHKVVLSACSSYFQSLFLDHPSRHPIVILKDVRFAELRTLIEFMYKGEVNVQYCQLSALLKTAESLKVKGLAEMTNQSSALREPEREQDHLRPPPSSPQQVMPDGSSSATNTNSKRLKSDRCSPSPTRHHHHQQQQQQQQSASSRKTPDDFFDKTRHQRSGEQYLPTNLPNRSNSPSTQTAHPHHSIHHHHLSQSAAQQTQRQQTPSPPTSLYLRKIHRERERDYNAETIVNEEPVSLKSQQSHKKPKYSSPIDGRRSRTTDEDIDEMDDEDDAMSNDHETGINMTINSNSLNSVPPILKSSSPSILNSSSSKPTDLQLSPPSSISASLTTTSLRNQSVTGNGSSSGTPSGGNVYSSATTTSTCTSTSSGLIATSPISSDPVLSTEPIAGPSGLGPVQSVPLSLKKEMDWDRSDDKSIGESSSDYRHAHESDASGGQNLHDTHSSGGSIVGSAGLQLFHCMYCGASFPHQSKLTRHILSHSLETLKYRESHLLHLTNFPHDAHFSQRPTLLEPLEPPDGSMDIDLAAAAAAAAANFAMAAASSSSGGSNSTSGSSASNNDQGNVVLCKFCGKSFPDVSSLITHLPVHTGDRPFKCEFCGKAFKLRHHMKDHCRVHTGERPFRCSMCGKTFSRSTILKAHEKTHFPKYVRKFLSPSPVDGKEEPPQ